jgi:hypothetical protein
MAVSGTISTTNFTTRMVIDRSYNRCGIESQRITAEMQQIALDTLYLIISEIAAIKVPSWCIEKIIFPFYNNQPQINMPTSTVEILNCNYRTLQQVTGTNTTTSTIHKIQFQTATIVNTVGILWGANSVPVVFEISDDNATWIQVGSSNVSAVAGEKVWTDIPVGNPAIYFRVRATSGTLSFVTIFTGNTPNETPMGLLNRDSYIAQNNKVFAGRPTTYWFQRDIPQPVIHLWPAPNAGSESAQLVVERHRYIMDVGNLQQTLDIPQRWFEAIIARLAVRLLISTPTADLNRLPILKNEADIAMNIEWTGDNDRSRITIAPALTPYTA